MEKRAMADDGEHDIDGDPGDVQENRLEGVEADQAVLVIGGEDQEQDSGEESEDVA